MRGRQDGDEKQIPKMPNNSVAIGVPVPWEKNKMREQGKKARGEKKSSNRKKYCTEYVKAYSSRLTRYLGRVSTVTKAKAESTQLESCSANVKANAKQTQKHNRIFHVVWLE